ncbi:hypothetical protein [Acinetobacter bereziniae]|uniref:hypothetical protein n=1 Tax=Acinetobacter bereziniae TaxID=106648 RepID=UPI00300A8D6C
MAFQQIGSDIVKAKDIYVNLFKEEDQVVNERVDQVKKSTVYTKSKKKRMP